MSQTYRADQNFPYSNVKVFLLHQALCKLHETSRKIQQGVLLLECIFLG